jgi:hypothetical protein
MGHEFSRSVKGRKLDPINVIPDLRKQRIGQTVRRLPVIISRKTPIDIRFLDTEKAAADIHGIGIDGRNHQNLFAGTDTAVVFQFPQCLHQLGTDIHLLDLIASGCANDAGRLLALAELKALDAHIFSVGRMYGINISLKHNLFTPSGSAPADLLHRPPDKLSG